MGRMSDRRRGSDRTMVRKKAQQGQAGTKGVPFTLPQGVEEWQPEEKGTVGMHILPYQVSRKGHPDGIKVGEMWYRRPFKVHTHVGPEDINVVCPTSIGMRCPICEEAKRLADADWKENEKDIKKLRAKNFAAYNVVLDGEEEVKVFAVSTFKFGDALEQELAEGDEANACFDDPDNGKMVSVRFSEEYYEGHAFYKAVRFDFNDREPVPDEWLAKAVDFDQAIIVKDYDTLHDLLFGIEDAKTAAVKEETAENDPDDEKKPEKEEPAWKVESVGGKRKDEASPKPSVKTKPAVKPPPPPKEEPVEDDIPFNDNSKKGDGNEDEIPEEDRCVACEGEGKTRRGNTCPICKGSGRKLEAEKPAAGKPAGKPAAKAPPPKKEPEEEAATEKKDDENWEDLDWEDDDKKDE